ncbi:MAG: NYN domain-containing protein [Anaerolinea sp.]|nr:NYN domain-containing protein [Anaerolinea sp.]
MYLIDGHNLIGQLDDISLDDPNDEAKLVQKLIGFAARMNKKCVVIFDQGITGGKSRMSTATVEVVFASPRTNADRVMMERIKHASNPDQWIVVSNDRMVLDAAQNRKMRALKSKDFAPLLKPAPAPQKDKRDKDAGSEVYPSPAEVEAWLKLFNERK